jgi:hypothetical protein
MGRFLIRFPLRCLGCLLGLAYRFRLRLCLGLPLRCPASPPKEVIIYSETLFGQLNNYNRRARKHLRGAGLSGRADPRVTSRHAPAADMAKKESGTVHSGEGEVSSAAFRPALLRSVADQTSAELHLLVGVLPCRSPARGKSPFLRRFVTG